MKKVLSAALISSTLATVSCAGQSDSNVNVAEQKKPVNNTQTTQQIEVKLETSLGDIVIELNETAAPKTVENFLSYVNSGYYDGTVFHRVIDNFMIQGGGFDTEMVKKPTMAAIDNEANNGLKNTVGSIAMARTNAPNSATSQFFINVADNKSLDYKNQSSMGYAVFGQVTQGMDVVEKIKSVPTSRYSGHQNYPKQQIVIISATVNK